MSAREFARPAARAFTGCLAVMASLWGMVMTPALWELFGLIALAGAINVVIGILDERQIRADRQMLTDVREYMRSLVGPADIPPHLQDLTRLSNAQLKRLVHKLSEDMIALNQKWEAVNYPRFLERTKPGADWAALNERDALASAQQHGEFQKEYHPQARALWQELDRRGSKVADRGDEIALEHGLLTGPYPVQRLARTLEELARKLSD